MTYCVTEAELDAARWASCGPTALAALLGRPLAELRPHFPLQREKRTWTNLVQMKRAINSLGVLGLSIADTSTAGLVEGVGISLTYARAWPRRGLAIVQFRGSWDRMPVHHAAQLTRSHWVACLPAGEPFGAGRTLRVDAVFDVNAVGVACLMKANYWQSRSAWERVMAPMVAEDFGKRATGQWWIRAGIEVS